MMRNRLLLALEPTGKDVGKCEGIMRIKDSMYTEVHTGPWFSAKEDRWVWIEEGPEDEPEGDWDHDSQKEKSRKRAKIRTVDHGSFSEMA